MAMTMETATIGGTKTVGTFTKTSSKQQKPAGQSAKNATKLLAKASGVSEWKCMKHFDTSIAIIIAAACP